MTPFYLELDDEWHIIRVVNGQGWKTYCDHAITTGKAPAKPKLLQDDRLCEKCRKAYEASPAGQAPNTSR